MENTTPRVILRGVILRTNMNYLDFFKELCAIPHGSGNTEAIGNYLCEFAKERSLEYHKDELGNVIIIKEASAKRACDEPVIIQGHMDMVAVKDDGIDKDMTKEGLDLETDGDFLFAKGTSLGADDGIAVAYALALLDSDLELPRLEVVITVDEEVGMEGASGIDLSCLKGHTMLNLDSEEEGDFIVSCAGGARVDFAYDCSGEPKVEKTPGLKIYEISMEGFLGGHSGTEIHKKRANAIRIMCKLLRKLSDAGIMAGLGDYRGGVADNAICNSCKAVILSKPIEPELFDMMKYESMDSYLGTEKNAQITFKEIDADMDFYKEGDFLHFLNSLPDGVVSMSKDMPELVETSLNHGIIKMQDGIVSLSLSIRSNVNEKKEELKKTLKELAEIRPVKMNIHGDYSGWAYREVSPLREKVVSLYEKMFGKKPNVLSIHAGLECGVLSGKIKDLDCVSCGPNIYDIHTTKERLSLSSAERMWEFLKELLK